MSYFVSKIGHLDPRFYSIIYCVIPGVQMSGVQNPDVGGPDVGGPVVGGPDVGGPNVPHCLKCTFFLFLVEPRNHLSRYIT